MGAPSSPGCRSAGACARRPGRTCWSCMPASPTPPAAMRPALAQGPPNQRRLGLLPRRRPHAGGVLDPDVGRIVVGRAAPRPVRRRRRGGDVGGALGVCHGALPAPRLAPRLARRRVRQPRRPDTASDPSVRGRDASAFPRQGMETVAARRRRRSRRFLPPNTCPGRTPITRDHGQTAMSPCLPRSRPGPGLRGARGGARGVWRR